MRSRILIFYTTLIIVFFVCTRFAYGGFEISEIMYDLEGTDTNREWIEVKNVGTESDDLSKWYFFSDNSKHALVPQGASLVPAGGYAVITQNVSNFQSDWPNYSGLIFDSSWTGFNNETGEVISLKDSNLNEVSIVSFDSGMGGAGDGNSLQKLGSTWSGATPTPGLENKSTTNNPPPATTSTPESSSSSANTEDQNIKRKETEVPKMATNIISKNTVFTGIPFRIDTNTLGYKKETLKVGRLVWNFGDGMSRTTSDHSPFEYMYQYPGEYVLALSYFYPDDQVVDATDRMIIKVVPAGVVISSVGGISDPYIEIENKSGFEVDLSGWVIKGAISSFYVPEGTIILPSKSIRFSSRITGFNANDLLNVNILSTNGEIVSSYPSTTGPSYTTTRNNNYKITSKPRSVEASSVINLDNLPANAQGAGIELSKSSYSWIGLLIITIIGIVIVLSTKKKHSSTDQEEKEISVDNIKILE